MGILRLMVVLAASFIISECNLQVRLRNGNVASEGRVEIFYNNQWGTICDDGWSQADARVVCRSLGYNLGDNIRATQGGQFGAGSGQIWLDDVRCTGTETGIEHCRHQPLGHHNCRHTEDAGVKCRLESSAIRLVGGNSSSEGRVEIYNNRSSTWGTVCDDRWDTRDAGVVCHQLGFSRSPAIPVSNAYFGQGTGPISYDDTMCTGPENGISLCRANTGRSDCTHTEDAGVICVPDNSSVTIQGIRLRGGRNEYVGRLEVNILGHWGTVCNRGFSAASARVACKMLGWSGGQVSVRAGRTTGPIFLSDVRCSGNESSLLDCRHKSVGETTCSHTYDVAVSCNPVTPFKLPIRLVGGNTKYEGRVEVTYQGMWGTVCDDMWDARDAAVVCRMLNFSVAGAAAVTKHGFGMGTGPIMLDDVQCRGTESNLALCSISQWKHTNCDHSEDAGVICQPPGTVSVNVSVRLTGGPDPHSGRLEVRYKNQWGTVCDDGFTLIDAKVVCRMLGFSTENMTVFRRAHFGAGTGTILLDDVVCTGTETNIALCGNRGWGRSNCGHSEDVSMSCGGGTESTIRVRLAGGQTPKEGRVEVMYNGQWGTVCDTPWDENAAAVVCRMLGMPVDGAQPRIGSFFGPGTGHVILSGVRCDGNETSLDLCDHRPWQQTSCSHSREAGVICGGIPRIPVRLRGGSTTAEGRVEVYFNNTWGTVCDDLFGKEEATVICKMLGFSAPLAVPVAQGRFGPGTGVILLDDLQCHGTESSILECASKGVGNSNCNHQEDAGVICEEDIVKWRLANGNNSTSGRLEVYLLGQWGTVCDDSFGSMSARVACRTLGLPSLNARAVTRANFGRGTGPIMLDNVMCRGNETNLLNCPHSAIMRSNCQHSEDVGVICGIAPHVNSTTVRLVGGHTPTEGRVEVFYNGAWGTVCDDGFTTQSAKVVCKWLGLNAIQAKPLSNAHYGSGSGTIVLDDVRCRGTEASLFDCSHRRTGTSDCRHNEDVGVQCLSASSLESKIRVVNGSSSHSGRVEINHGGQWGTICDDSWGLAEAAVACRQLGFNNANGIPVPEAYFGAGTGSIVLDELGCTGNESQLTYCRHNRFGQNDCDHTEDAGVICLSGSPTAPVQVRLVGGIAANQGRVEVKYRGFWGTVCDDNFDNHDAAVICRMIGHPRGGRTLSHVGSGQGPVWIDEVHCLGNEDSIANCTGFQWGENDCDHSEDAGVFCFADVNFNYTARLVNGPTPHEGRVEILFNNTWHTVCDDDWSAADAAVVCRMLNMGTDGATAVGKSAYGRGTGRVLLDDVTCRGTESNLAQCQSAELWVNNCDHSEDAGVKCSTAGQVTTSIKVRLVNGPNPRAGRVEVFYNNVWGTVCDDHWDVRDAQVVCRMLGFPTDAAQARTHGFFRQGTGPIQLDDVNCRGNETSLALCGHRPWRTSNCHHSEDAGVVCPGGDAHPTSIRLVGGLRGNEGRVEVFYNNTWGTVCDDGFGVEEAQVVCRSLGFSVEGARAYSSSHFGRGRGQIVYDDLRCRGTELSLDLCFHLPIGRHNCDHTEDAGVLCPRGGVSPTQIRLVHGSSPSQGRVEIMINGTWGTVCDDLFTNIDAGVVCAMLGFQRDGAIAKPRGFFGRGAGPIYLDDVQCNGQEANILECPAKPVGHANCNHGEDVGIICRAESVSVRLVGGTSRYEGRLELNINGTWGTVCDDSFGTPDAMVACRMLHFPVAGARVSRVRRTGTGTIWLDDLGCYGTETSLLQCRRHRGPLGSNNCRHTEDVSVMCSSVAPSTTRRPTLPTTTRFPPPDPNSVFVRLAGGKTAYEGRVEVYFANTTGTVCDDFWTINSTKVICGMLGYSKENARTVLHGNFDGPVPVRTWLDDVRCVGSETHIARCPSAPWGTENCGHSEDVGVACSSSQRPDNFWLLADSSGGMIYRMASPSYSIVPLVPIPHAPHPNNPMAIDYDPVEGQIYWTDVGTWQILSANLDGTERKVMVQMSTDSVSYGLAVDPLSRNLYFTDNGKRVITVMSLDGFAQKIIVNDNLENPRDIAVHPYRGLMFWTDLGTHPKIETSLMDGTNRRTIVSTSLKMPNGIAIDYRANRIYWCDAGTSKVESSDFNGQGRRSVASVPGAQFYGITLTDSYFYVTQWNGNFLLAGRKSGNTNQLTSHGPPMGRLNGIVYQRKGFGITGSTLCSQGRGGCSHLCIPRYRSRRVCLCPDGLTLQPDGVSCGTDVPCPVLTAPVMGQFVPENCTTGNSSVGTVCNATCKPGFSLIGPSKVTCLGTGQWSHLGNTLVCRDTQPPKLTCPADITATAQKGSTSATVTWKTPTVTENGDGTVQIVQSINSPASLKEGRYTVFVSATDGRGLSSFCTFGIIVTVKRCGPLVLPTGAYLSTPSCPLYYGTTCSVQCRRGYQSPNKNLQQVTCDQGSGGVNGWTTGKISCKPVVCQALNVSQNAAVTGCKAPFSVGAVCLQKCNQGYQITGGSASRRCSSGGTWTGSNIVCALAPSCPVLTSPANVVISCQAPYTVGKLCTQRCNSGFMAVAGTTVRQCQRGKTWSGSALQCKGVGFCQALEQPGNGKLAGCVAPFAAGSVCSQSCNDGFLQTSGTDTRQCLQSGTWSGSPLSCVKPPSCSRLSAPGNGSVNGCPSSSPVGGLCVQSCNHGYKMASGSAIRVCQSDGTWSGQILVCTWHNTTRDGGGRTAAQTGQQPPTQTPQTGGGTGPAIIVLGVFVGFLILAAIIIGTVIYRKRNGQLGSGLSFGRRRRRNYEMRPADMYDDRSVFDQGPGLVNPMYGDGDGL